MAHAALTAQVDIQVHAAMMDQDLQVQQVKPALLALWDQQVLQVHEVLKEHKVLLVHQLPLKVLLQLHQTYQVVVTLPVMLMLLN
jgi:hypothetical protein